MLEKKIEKIEVPTGTVDENIDDTFDNGRKRKVFEDSGCKNPMKKLRNNEMNVFNIEDLEGVIKSCQGMDATVCNRLIIELDKKMKVCFCIEK